jgi:putative transposase
MLLHKAFKFRIYPTQAQCEALAIQFGHARFVYNHYRAICEDYYLDTGTRLSYRDCTDDLANRLKDEYPWLKEANSQVLQQSLKNLNAAYQNFFTGRAKYPRFKPKHGTQSIRYPQRFKVNDKCIYLPKVGWIRAIVHRPIEGKMKNCTVSKTKSGKYFASIQCEMEVEDSVPFPTSVGIDLGLATFATFSTGEKIDKPRYLHRSERRLKIRQRRLSRKRKGSHSRSRTRLRVAAQYEHIANQRRDFHHKLSRRLANTYGYIAFESLNIAGLLKNHNLAKAIADAGWSQFVTFTTYKAHWAGGGVLKVDQFFPSSRLCSNCGEKHHHLPLSVRSWVCLTCEVIHDRDVNAARNIWDQATAGAAESHALGDTSVQDRCSAREA